MVRVPGPVLSAARRFAVAGLAAAAGLAATLHAPAPAGAQVLGHASGVCGDTSKGASVVARSPVSPEQGSVSTVLIFHHGSFADAYVQELRYMAAPPKTDSVEAARALQAHTQRYLAAMNQVFSHARFTQPDERGVILCGGLGPGTYDVLAIAQLVSVSTATGTQSVGYYLTQAVVPNGGSRPLVRAGSFVRL